MQFSNKQKTFSHCFGPILQSRSNLNILKKKLTLIAYIFPKFSTAKNVVRENVFTVREHAKVSRTLLQSARQHLY